MGRGTVIYMLRLCLRTNTLWPPREMSGGLVLVTGEETRVLVSGLGKLRMTPGHYHSRQ